MRNSGRDLYLFKHPAGLVHWVEMSYLTVSYFFIYNYLTGFPCVNLFNMFSGMFTTRISIQFCLSKIYAMNQK
jgi:hypothetical protein